MEYSSVKTAILNFLKCLILTGLLLKEISIHACILYFSKTVIPHEKCTKIIYNILNENVVFPIAVTKWKTYLTDYNVKYLTVYDILKICFKTTNLKDSSVK